MGWQYVTVPARKVIFSDGTEMTLCIDTGFLQKDGVSKKVKDFVPGDQFMKGKTVVNVIDEGKTIDIFLNLPEEEDK